MYNNRDRPAKTPYCGVLFATCKGLFVIYGLGGVGDFQPIQAYEKFTPPRKWVF